MQSNSVIFLNSFFTIDHLQSFKTIFISLILEALPFILLGVLLSSLLQTFVPESTIRRFTPRNPVLGILFACLLGILFPMCECGMIPIVRRLILKGMPVYIAVVFIIAGPILNPIVFAATLMAFRNHPSIAYSRMVLAFIVVIIIGLILYRLVKRSPLRLGQNHESKSPLHDVHHLHDNHHYHHSDNPNKVMTFFVHSSSEFFEMGKFLVFGALLTALIQVFMQRESLLAIGQGPLSSHFFMMGLAYILSICSTSDAFVASSFQTSFTSGSLLTFLVFGPMLDFKSTLMLLSVFKIRFVLLLVLLISCTVLICSLLWEQII
ncbi:Putative two-component membrane permease complex subunit SMU_747c [Paenibacillus allorhizoplanae]|uniref:Two-component membrane permease complex subunit SMU_747c n=1 Tax=Paenibacillus allorhizoplanae TaxID=2905648 RepID=A0ABN8FYH7_9BACL|nr:permease [Paenibacillus allorhizoplanae]CAH1194878.1 Putative two-component membrane permease complex subunit SMU_747c [Paenibacillus allorhizoplanae]